MVPWSSASTERRKQSSVEFEPCSIKNGCQKYFIIPIFIHTLLLVYGQQQQRIM